jgi:hypothetical protein
LPPSSIGNFCPAAFAVSNSGSAENRNPRGEKQAKGAVYAGMKFARRNAIDRRSLMNISSLGAFMPSASSPSNNTPTPKGGAIESPADSVEEQFLKYARMSPMERMRASILGSMGLTEDDLSAMSAADRQKVEDKIKQMIEQKMKEAQKEKGQLVDFAA